ncbi:MAG: recombinase family protein [Bacteroidia bacterium]|nr:recombinase family protein [Bacteroidia bacterium]
MQTYESVRYFLYARKSSDSEDRQMASIPDQIEVMTQLAKQRGITITDIITESKSAKQPGRPAFNDMMNRIKCGEADGLLCWKLNRLARNPIDAGEVSWLLQRSVIKHIQTHGQDYKPTDNVLMMQVEFGIANEYVKNLSADVIRGLSMKAKRGWYPNNKVALGYIHNAGYKLGEPEIIPDPKKYDLVKHLWELMLSGQWSIRELQKEAYRIGLVNSMGKPLSKSVFYRMFNSQFYAGYFDWNHGEEGVIRHKGKHKRMITLEEYERVQILLGKRGNRIRGSQKYEFRYRGPFSCGECGGHITAEHKFQVICTRCKKKFSAKTESNCPVCQTNISEMINPSVVDKTYYRCTKNVGPCSQPCIEEKDLEEKITKELRKISIPKRVAVLIQKSIENVKGSPNLKIKETLHQKHTQDKKSLANLIKMRIEGEIDQRTFLQYKADLEVSLIKTEDSLQSEDKKQAWKGKVFRDLSIASNIPNDLSKLNNSEVKSVISEVASNLVIVDRKPLFYFKKPYLVFRELYEKNRAKIDSFEPKKALEKQGLSGMKYCYFPIGRAERDILRTLYLDSNDINPLT